VRQIAKVVIVVGQKDKMAGIVGHVKDCTKKLQEEGLWTRQNRDSSIIYAKVVFNVSI
jgi:hypothetical protein